jgi:hypothetical protein
MFAGQVLYYMSLTSSPFALVILVTGLVFYPGQFGLASDFTLPAVTVMTGMCHHT